MTAIKSFTNPFTIADKEHLYCIASGAPVSREVEYDVLRAEVVGKKVKETFVKERLHSESVKNFFDPIPRQKLLTMEACSKNVTLTSTKGKVNIFPSAVIVKVDKYLVT